ncbi:MAG TPA: phosphatase PAP2 family protein [Solirubrobacteraceae bacterium]|nr:phosphatase PAP2 family protein [Solirubrobacteraceae bacterium]
MPSRARMALIGAGTGVVLLAAVWYAAHYIALGRSVDASVLSGFHDLTRPGLDRLTNFTADLCDPHRYVFLAAIPVIVALVRGRPRVAAMLVFVLLCANETTQLLKPLLTGPRDQAPGVWIDTASWPSGHATAAMSLALCSVIAAPARRRPVVAGVMAAFAIAVSYSFLELGWHYPSDVLGGFLVAGTWTLLGIAGLSIVEARHAGSAAEPAPAARPSFSVGEALAPVGVLAALACVLAGLILLARPHEVLSYVRDHQAFVIGAGGIGALGTLLASGLTLMLRRT